MEDAEVVKLLQHNRHDLMNDLQIVQGYIKLKKPEKAEEKLLKTIKYYNEERKLMHVMDDQFILWLMQVNIIFSHINLEYHILTEKKLRNKGHELTTRCKKIISSVNETFSTHILYDISLQIKDTENPSFAEVSFLIKGEYSQEALLRRNLNDDNVKVRKTASGMICSFLI